MVSVVKILEGGASCSRRALDEEAVLRENPENYCFCCVTSVYGDVKVRTCLHYIIVTDFFKNNSQKIIGESSGCCWSGSVDQIITSIYLYVYMNSIVESTLVDMEVTFRSIILW